MNNFTLLVKQSLIFFCLCGFIGLQAQPAGLVMTPMTTCTSKTIDVEVRTNTWTDITSMQFTLEWDSDVLQYMDVALPNNTFSDLQFGYSNTATGKITASWLDQTTTGINITDEVAFVITFMVIGAEGEQSPVAFISDPTVIEFTYNNGGVLTEYTPTLEDGSIILESPYLDGATLTPANGDDSDGAVSINIAGGTGPYLYEWNNSMNTASINNLSAGDYLCTVTDASTCSSTHGPFTVESIVGIHTLAGLTQFELLPNPASEFVNLNVAFAKNENTSIRIMDVTGKTQYQSNHAGSTLQLNIPVNDLANGTYFVELKTQEGTAVEKLIITK